MTQAQEEEYSREVAKLHFEFFKHFATISTATAVIVLALAAQQTLSLRTVVVGLASLGTTLIISVLGMFYVPAKAAKRRQFKGSGGSLIYILFSLTVGSFIFGIAWYVISVVLLWP